MSADLLARLIEAGTPAALVAEVAMLAAQAAAASSADPVAERRREWDKQYRRERREAERAALSGGSGGRRVDNADSADTAPTLDKKAPQTPKRINPTPGVCSSPACEAEHPTGPIIAAWLGVMLVIAEQRRKRWGELPPPLNVTDEQWQGFLDHRKAKGEKLTPRARHLLCLKLEQHADDEWPPGRIVDQMVERGWLSFEPAWLQRATEQRNGQRHHSRGGSGNHHPGGRTGAAADFVFDGMDGGKPG